MPFCAQCGAQFDGSFCPACGAPAGGPATNPASSAAPLDDHIVHALCYVLMPLTGVLFLVVEPYKNKREVRFHAVQSILVFAALFAAFMALTVLALTPIVGLLFSLVTLFYPLLAFGTWFFLSLKAFRQEKVVVPILGRIAETKA